MFDYHTVSSVWLCRNTAQRILSFKCVFVYQHLMFTHKIMPNFTFMCTTTQSSTPTTAEQCKAPQTAWEIQLRNRLENQRWLKDSGSVSHCRKFIGQELPLICSAQLGHLPLVQDPPQPHQQPPRCSLTLLGMDMLRSRRNHVQKAPKFGLCTSHLVVS